jgi:hypothetical protein
MSGSTIALHSLLACSVLLFTAAARADDHRYVPLSFDPHEKSSVAIASLKSIHEQHVAPPVPFSPEHHEVPRFDFNGKRLRFRLPF